MLRNVIQNDWFTALIVLCLVLVAVAKVLNTKRFLDFAGVLFNSSYLKIYLKEQKFINKFDSVLFLNLIISLSIFIVLAWRVFYGEEQVQNLDFYYRLVVGVGSIILIKVLIDRLIGSLFEIDTLMNYYVFQKITFKNFLGIILLPINILLIYAINPSKNLIYLTILLLLLINIIGFIISIRHNLKTVKNNMFYFILYLCALEIAPYLILFKVVS